MKSTHYLLVFIQFAGISYFVFTGSVFTDSIALQLLIITAMLIGLWSVVSMKLHTLTVLPSVKQGGQLCTSGPYRVVRHPMYTAVLLLLLALLLTNYSHVSLAVYCVVVVNFIFKITVEEKILRAHYPDYKEYMKRTKRIIPFLY